MSIRRRAAVAAVVLAAVASMSACAVPGQGVPGVAATYDGRVITVADTVAFSDTMDLFYARPHPGEALTLMLLEPGIMKAANDLGFAISDESLQIAADIWSSAAQGDQHTITAGEREILREIEAINYLALTPGGFEALAALVTDAEQGVVASPRYGPFTVANFDAKFQQTLSDIDHRQDELGPAVFALFKEIDGFAAQLYPTWIQNEVVPKAQA